MTIYVVVEELLETGGRTEETKLKAFVKYKDAVDYAAKQSEANYHLGYHYSVMDAELVGL